MPDSQAREHTASPNWMRELMAEKEAHKTEDRKRRMTWWREAKYGMFVHLGLYSLIGRHEWVMNRERIPAKEYEAFAGRFNPSKNAPRKWARLAREAGQKYMVFTTKHHEGYCLFHSELTDYCSTKRGPKRDIVAEYVEAARAEGLRVGFYYSLLDWHHPDGTRCAHDEAARKRFVAYTHGLLREICSNYGKVDVLWYDVPWPLSAEGWESRKMNRMVRKLQPDIIINNRSKVPEDFGTPEQHITPEKDGRAWESCMTLNGSWGYTPGDTDWKPASTILRNLFLCMRLGGNYLLNIGPKPDGSIPAPTVRILRETGAWIERNHEAMFETDLARSGAKWDMEWMPNVQGLWTVGENKAYLPIFAWPGRELGIGGLQCKVKDVRFLVSGQPVRFKQKGERLLITDLPDNAPDKPATVLVIECAGTPRQALGYGTALIENDLDRVYAAYPDA